MKFAESGQVGCLLQAANLVDADVVLAAIVFFFLAAVVLNFRERNQSEQVLFHIKLENHKLSGRNQQDF